MVRWLVIAILAVAIHANADTVIGTPSGGGDSYRWEIHLTDYDRITLRIMTPDEELYGKSFPHGAPVALHLRDLPGDQSDGDYSWELRVVPRISAQARKELAAARAAGDDKAARRVLVAAGAWNPPVQTGGFVVRDGAIVDTSGKEESAHDARLAGPSSDLKLAATGATGPFLGREPVANDQVIPDDLIVQGSLCVGVSCVNGEMFGFDTIRMKEANLRIRFDDTSTGGFPAVDWQLIANDSTSGGQSHFSIEDSTNARTPLKIEAGATTNSVYVDSTGRVGFRTAAPLLDLHINTGNTPAIRFEQTDASGFTAQTWDIAGNEVNFFVRDITDSSKMPFRIRPGAPTSSIDIRADGKVGIGTPTPAQKLDVAGGNIQLDIGSFILWDSSWGISQDLATSQLRFVQGTPKMAITSTGLVGIGTTTPASLLHVNGGDIRVSGGSFIDDGVTLNVPDYVFEETYALMPMPELAKFIREQKHLPNVPSAREIAAGGLNMSQFQMRLLEKVEELTLYTLQQHQTIAALQSRLEALEEELAKKP